MFPIRSAMPELPSAYPLRDLWDAAIRHKTVKLTCSKCGHVAILSASSLWYLFHRNGWNERFAEVSRRCLCLICLHQRGLKIRNPRLELVDETPTEMRLPEPPELEWKREMRRRR
jgi:hypothetical protein